MRRDDTIHDEHSSAQGLVQGSHAGVQVFRNETMRGSWRAELALGPADRIIVDGRSAVHAVQQLLAVLPAALAARPQHSTGHTMSTIHALHPSGCAVFLQVPSLEEVDAAIADLLRRGRGVRGRGGDRTPTAAGMPCVVGVHGLAVPDAQDQTAWAHTLQDLFLLHGMVWSRRRGARALQR